MVFGAAIGFGNMSFNHPVQIQTCYLLIVFVMGAGMQKLETGVFVVISDRPFFAFYFVSV